MAIKLSAKAWKYIFEIRYPATAYLFDRRGFLIEQFKGEPFTKWRIERNRIDLYDKGKTISVFAGFKNAGATVENPPNYTYFRDHIQRWLRLITPEIKYNRIDRIGFRAINLVEINNLSFEQLFRSFVNSYLTVNQELWGLKVAKPKDIGIVVDLVDGDNKLHVVTGPMEQVQAKTYFESNEVQERVPQLSIFADVDYFASNPNFEESRMIQAIMRFVNDAAGKIESYLGEYMGIFKQ